MGSLKTDFSKVFQQVFQQVPSPSILTGDFNAHNPLWGSTTLNPRGELVEEVAIHTRNFNLLNTGVATHMCMASGTTSCIDLTFCSRSMLHRLEWTVVDDLHGSNHFPILVYIQANTRTETRPSFWVLRKANWEVFTHSIQLPENYTGDVESMATLLENEIIRAAKESIPRNKGKVGQSPVPWWNEEINEAIRSRKRALNKLKQHPTMDHLIQYKRLRARARYLIKDSKRTTWRTYISSITSYAPTSVIWRKIRSIRGNRTALTVRGLLVNGNITTSPEEIAEELATHFADISSSAHYNVDFLRYKNQTEQNPIDFSSRRHEDYNDPFTLPELQEALNRCKPTAPGPDLVHNKMLQNLSLPAQRFLLLLFNRIWIENVFPSGWREAIIIPIPKEERSIKTQQLQTYLTDQLYM